MTSHRQLGMPRDRRKVNRAGGFVCVEEGVVRADIRDGRTVRHVVTNDRRHNQKLNEPVWAVRTRFRLLGTFRELVSLRAATVVAPANRQEDLRIIALVCGLLPGAFGASAALALLKGSQPVPWDVPSADGPSEAEKTFRATALRWNKLGVAMLLAAFVLSPRPRSRVIRVGDAIRNRRRLRRPFFRWCFRDLGRGLVLSRPPEVETAKTRKEHIANIEQNWYKVP